MMAEARAIGIGEIEVGDRAGRSGSLPGFAALRGETLDGSAVGGDDLVEPREMRVRCEQLGAQLLRRVSNGSGLPSTADSARRIAQSSRASPGGNTARAVICARPSVLT